MTRIFTLLAALFAATTLNAQTYPERLLPGLNDFASLVDADTASRIDDKITNIFETHGVEVSIATLSSLRFYAQDSTIEDYGPGLFNAWSVGNADDNNGILMLVFRDDREVRIVLGEGFEADAQKEVARVIDEDILPDFRGEDYAQGIEAGVDGLLTRLIAPPPANTAVPTSDENNGSGNTLYYVLAAVVAAIAGIFGLNRRAAAKLAATPCTNCGKTGLQKSREVLSEATLEAEGRGETRLTCPSCGHVDATPFTISKLKPEGPQGGGKTDGKGATGKW